MSKIYVRVRWDGDSMGVTMYQNNDLALRFLTALYYYFLLKIYLGFSILEV